MIVFPERIALCCSFLSDFLSLCLHITDPFWFHVSVNWSKVAYEVLLPFYM